MTLVFRDDYQVIRGPAISVVVTCYNYGKYLDDALRSVKAQSFEDWECIIVDDGSDDDTPDISRAWTGHDRRFVYLRQRNSGLSAARNAGLAMARGRYIQILDADDMILPEKFKIQTELLGALPEDSLVYSSYEHLCDPDPAGPRYQGWPRLLPRRPLLDSLILDWERSLSIPPHCFMFRRSHFGPAASFDVDLETHEDIDLYLKLAACGVNFVHHKDVLAVYRRHGANMTMNRARMTRGYLLALGHASRRISTRRDHLLVVYRYLVEFERGLTDWILRRHRKVGLGSILFSQYRPLSMLGLLVYPFLVLRRALERSKRLIGSR